MSTQVIGFFAAAVTLTGFVAQVWKILRTRDTSTVVLPTWLLSALAFSVWTVYGVLLGEWPIIVPNVLCFLITGFIVALKLMPRKSRDAIADALVPQPS
ncbi:MAG TPA: SemiSWEET family transporter [Kofleriaceae bacterium]|nr:SemiSWEET family transporter [Kofleriaceae bacterium]